MMDEERVRYYASLNDPVMHGQTVRFSFDEAAQLAADWLALRQQNAALRALAYEAIQRGCPNPRCADDYCQTLRARLAALGEP